jgi:hypothetical protein
MRSLLASVVKAAAGKGLIPNARNCLSLSRRTSSCSERSKIEHNFQQR